MGIFLYLVLIYGIYRVVRHAFRFEKVSRFEQVTLPAYSLIMFVFTMHWQVNAVGQLLIVVVLAALIGWFQASAVVIQTTEEVDKSNRPIVLVKKNWPYIVGWVLIFLLGIGFQVVTSGLLDSVEVLETARDTVVEELFSFTRFGSQYSWYIWAISAVSGIVYTLMIRHKEPLIGKAIKERQRVRRRKDQ